MEGCRQLLEPLSSNFGEAGFEASRRRENHLTLQMVPDHAKQTANGIVLDSKIFQKTFLLSLTAESEAELLGPCCDILISIIKAGHNLAAVDRQIQGYIDRQVALTSIPKIDSVIIIQ